ncbi:MAG: 3-hydroxyacyl-CoA dehydrogenase NAD-binding domain-containing protein [Pirellulales bacterium]
MANAFQFEELDGKIGLVTFDLPDEKVNTLGKAIVSELAELVDSLEGRDDLKGLLFCSGKPGQFIAGANLNELGALAEATREDVQQAMATGHELFSRISRLPYPTIALIDGHCMGGGTELVLSMDERIASDNRKTNIALPEVKVGLFPAWGGTQRLPRLIGINASIQMICTGETVFGPKAAELGLVFDVVPADDLIDAGRRTIEYLNETGEWQETRQRRNQPVGLSDDEFNFAFAVSEGFVRGQTKGQYPAPLAALKAMKEGINRPLDEGLKIEQEIALDIIGSQISANLINVFFMGNQLKSDRGIEDSSIVPRDVGRVGVLGSGLMGAGIATAHARRGVPASMVDVDNDRVNDGMKRAAHVVASRMKIGRATAEDMQQLLALLSTGTSEVVFSDCDVVVEAITENEKWKTEAYKKIGPALNEDAILASNTSTISITRMAEAAPNPERFAGMHFFYPVDRMQLVEVIRDEKTSDETVATLVQLSKRIGKTPIVMKDCAGFLVNRILFPYMNESVQLLLEGASMDAIDKTATRFGMPMGPIALSDLVGIDTSFYAGQVIADAYSDRTIGSPLLGQLVKAGRMGKKSGSGFRKFVGKKMKPAHDPDFNSFLEANRVGDKQFTDEEVPDRLFLPMLLEAIRCVDEEIVREPAHVDMGLILGIGFPPFRGGILRWCDSMGAAEVLKKLEPYIPLGKRFEPTESLTQMASSGGKFFASRKATG